MFFCPKTTVLREQRRKKQSLSGQQLRSYNKGGHDCVRGDAIDGWFVLWDPQILL
jgi:hypothetical protein